MEPVDYAPENEEGAKMNAVEIHKHVIDIEKSGEVTLADHAEAWASENGEDVPERGTKAWKDMYSRWITFAFRMGV